MAIVAVPGLTLSALTFVLLGYLLRDAFRRRGDFPSLTYGGRVLRQRTLALLWGGILITGFVVGLGSGMRVASRTIFVTEPVGAAPGELRSSRTVTITLPFFHYSIIENEVLLGDPPPNAQPAWQRVDHGQLQIPLIFLVTAGFYWVAVMRWSGDRSGVGSKK